MDCSAKAYSGTEPFIFISYAHDDAHLVYPIVERLALDGFRVWYDDGIHAGEDWTETVAQRLDESTICMPMLTENYVDSVNCRNELAYSLNAGKTVISVKLTDFEMPRGIRLQLGNALYLERYRYGETEFYERLMISHGVGGCRDEAPRITDGELMAWRDKWANATPIKKAKGEPDRVKLQSPDLSKGTKSGPKKGLFAGIAALVVLAVLAVVLLPRLMKKESPAELTPAVSGTEETQPVSAETPAVTSAPEETPAPDEETPLEETPAEAAPVWRELKITPEGEGLQVLSCRYRGNAELLRIDFYETALGDIEGYFYAYFEENDELASMIYSSWCKTSISDEELELQYSNAQKQASRGDVPDEPQNPIAVWLRSGELNKLGKNRKSIYLLWFVTTVDRRIGETVITEIGYPSAEDLAAKKPETYTVTFDANGGFFDAKDTKTEIAITVPAGMTITRAMIPQAKSADGTMLSFDWCLDPKGTKLALSPDGLTPTEDMRVYAKYDVWFEITVDFNGGNFNGRKEPVIMTLREGFYSGDVVTNLSHDDPDMVFTGFYLDKACTEENRIPDDKYVPTVSPITLYAGWEKRNGG